MAKNGSRKMHRDRKKVPSLLVAPARVLSPPFASVSCFSFVSITLLLVDTESPSERFRAGSSDALLLRWIARRG